MNFWNQLVRLDGFNYEMKRDSQLRKKRGLFILLIFIDGLLDGCIGPKGADFFYYSVFSDEPQSHDTLQRHR